MIDLRSIRTWLCYYGLDAPLEAYAPFDLVIFDSTYHPDLVRREDGGPVILGYLSAAEVLEQGPLWTRARDQGILVRKKPLWNSWVLDMRNPGWQDVLIGEAVPGILNQGFDGVFLDTLDSALALELWADETRFRGTKRAVIRLMENLRATYSNALIAVNRGLPVLPDIAATLDALVIEGLSSIHEGPGPGYVPVDPDVQRLLLRQLHAGLEKRPGLPVFTLDYAPEDRPDLIENAITVSRRKGFIPYVSTVPLDTIYTHTLDGDRALSGPLPPSGRRTG